jgi:HlyD family secretion protein
MKSLIKRVVLVLIILGLVGTAAAAYFWRDNEQSLSFRTAPVTQGELIVSLRATGTVEPEEVINVGAQVAGQILSFGKDTQGKTVDYGSTIEAETVLAKIDDSLFATQAAEASAQLQSAQASLQRSVAELEQTKAKFYQADRDWQRAQKLGSSDALSQSSYDAYKSGYETAKATISVGEAAILQAKASVAQAEASLQRAQRNLSYCTIKSPVKGVIIDRRVNIGQTVVASLNAPSLFLIAKDLKRMQVWVAVNEADIGKIHPGQPVTFAVDSFPGEIFHGEVGKVRLNASMTQNVVTYTVEIITDNSSGRLLPYLTANMQFTLDRRSNVLRVPNAALRWIPSDERIAPEYRKTLESLDAGKKSRGEDQRLMPRTRKPEDENSNLGTVWVVEGGYVRPLQVNMGLTDGTMTEVEGEGLTAGIQIATGVRTQATGPADTTNPFAPKLPSRQGRT